MFTDSDTNGTTSESRNRTPFVAVAISVVLILLGGVLYSRGSSTPAADPARPAATQRNVDTVAFYGNGQLKVLSFYANPVEVKRGTHALVCYGVSNASTVQIEPAIGETWPSTSRCLEVTPTKDTEYKLTARDAAGREETRTVALKLAR